jgi:hypothetical protein
MIGGKLRQALSSQPIYAAITYMGGDCGISAYQ